MVERKKPTDNGLLKHWENFIAAIKSGKQDDLNCPISTGSHIATVCQLGNIAYRSKEKITWDKTKQQLTNEKLNQQYLFAQYHNGYKLQKV
jgi:hypothetical protein